MPLWTEVGAPLVQNYTKNANGDKNVKMCDIFIFFEFISPDEAKFFKYVCTVSQ